MKKTAVFFFLSLFQYGYSQIEDLLVEPSTIDKRTSFNKITASPEVTAFQKINFLPVNLYTGKPDIEIPLYTIKTGDIEVPVSIKYDIGGNKVDERASYVGWGWSLQAGGNITRIIRDMDDHEYDYVPEITPCTNSGYCDVLDLQSENVKLLRLGYLRRVNDGLTAAVNSTFTSNLNEDALPDLFLAHAPGLSTKFYMERSFSNYDDTQYYPVKVVDGSLTKIESPKYLNFNVDPIINFSGFNQADAAPNIYTNPPAAYNLTTMIRGNGSGGGLVRNKSKDYGDFNVTNDKGVKYNFSSFDINESTPAFYGDVNFYNGQGLYGWPMTRHFVKSYKINKGAWHLNQIKDLGNKEVNFYYTPVYRFEYDKTTSYTGLVKPSATDVNKVSAALGSGVHYNFISSLGIYYITPISTTGGNTGYQVYPENVEFKPFDTTQPLKSEGLNKTTQQQFINKIAWDEGEVLFYYDLNRTDKINSKALTEIKVKNNAGNVIKHYKFNYTYFQNISAECTTSSTDEKCYRLRLDNIEDINTNNIKTSTYSFEYDPSAIPQLYSKSKDYLGYYNGANNVVGLNEWGYEFYYSPKFTFIPNKGRLSMLPFQNTSLNSNSYITIDGQATINPNGNSMNGLLKKITYPTGGYTAFIYENNVFHMDGYDIVSGGSRIKNQVLSDGNGNYITKSYEYLETDGKSSGSILNFPKFADLLLWNSNNKNLSFQTYSYDKAAIELTQGAYVGYSRVVEKIQGKGRTEYVFNSSNEYPNEYESPSTSFFAKHSFYPARAYTDHDNRRGTIKNKIIYDNNGIKLQEENNIYSGYKVISSLARNFSVASMNKNGIGYFIPEKGTYTINILNSINRPSYKEIIEYRDGQALKTKVDFSYTSPYHTNLTESKTTFPSGDTVSKGISYVQDVTNMGNFGTVMVAKNMVSIPMEEKVVKNNNKISESRTVYAPIDVAPEELTTRYLPKTYYKNLGPEVLDISSSDDKIYTIDQYDNVSNIIQYTKENGIPVTMIWGYNQTQPIAKIEGATYAQVSPLASAIITASNTDASASINNDESALLAVLDSFRNNTALSGYQVSTYTYDPLIGVRSITPPSGIREYYIYDSANRLEKVVDSNGNILKEYKYNYKQ